MSQDEMNTQAFMDEANDLLAELETSLLELEETPDDRELVDRVFRAMHTIKGSGAMFGFDEIAAFTHDVETVFDKVREDRIQVSKDLLDYTLKACDYIKALLDGADSQDAALKQNAKFVLEGLKTLSPDDDTPAGAPSAEQHANKAPTSNDKITYHIRFKPHVDIFLTGTNPVSLLEELLDMGKGRVIAHCENVPPLDALEAEHCHIWWDILLTTGETPEAVKDVFIFVEDECEIVVREICRSSYIDFDEEVSAKLGEILVERGDICKEDLEAVLEKQRRLGEILANEGLVSEEKVTAALEEQNTVRTMSEQKKKTDAASGIRVDADRLDDLVDLVGELVIVQAQLHELLKERNDPQLQVLSEQLEYLSDELRDGTLRIRMLQIGSTFSRFRRLVRDLSGELGKEIEFETIGAETELDKNVLERLKDPMVHLIRNSIDHGIETPAEREAAGKNSVGKIILSAEHSGGEVLIKLKDDGKGLNKERIRARAVERGIISPDAELSEKEIFELIFSPGFSTAEKVTNVSGRGVGMDVVKRSIDSLRGRILIDSKEGQGTTITVKLPLTLAIIDGLQVKVQEEYYVIPLSLVEECVELIFNDHSTGNGRQILNLRGETVPYIRIREWFEVGGDNPPIEQVVVTTVEGSRIGIVVDNVIGEHQTVIKSLGSVYRDVEGLSGATIKGDGSMALILDVPKLVQSVVSAN